MSPNGDIYPCETKGYPNVETMSSNIMGSIRDFNYDITKLLESNLAKKNQHEIKSNKCHCNHGIDALISMLSSPKFQFKLLRESLIKVKNL
jgi:hypothetical protein